MAKTAALFQLGMDLEAAPRKAQAEVATDNGTVTTGPWAQSNENLDHFMTRNGKTYAGTHLIVDLWGASRIDDIDHVEKTLIDAVSAAGATLLHIHLHHFTPNGGVSGVVVLAESHISIHTWPERGYAALDVFMCGDSEPHRAIPILERAFAPEKTVVDEIFRGDVEAQEQ